MRAAPSRPGMHLTGNEEKSLTVLLPRARSMMGKEMNHLRTGCLTCKFAKSLYFPAFLLTQRNRRVKCDEGKPSCWRCLKFGVECQGYSDPKVEPKSRTLQSRALKPRKFLQPLPSTVSRMSFGPSFGSEQEPRYFRIFCNETARQIAGSCKVRTA
jgi:hypothetical protein